MFTTDNHHRRRLDQSMTDEEVYVDDCSPIRRPKLSFDLLAVEISSDDLNLSNSSITDEVWVEVDGHPITKRRRSRASKKKRKKNKNKKKNKKKNQGSTSDDFMLLTTMELGGEKIENLDSGNGVRILERRSELNTVFGSGGGLVEQELKGEVQENCVSSVELRQRNATGGRGWEEVLVEESSISNSSMRQSSTGLWMPVQNGNREKLEKELSLDWSKVMEERRDVLGGVLSTERSPFSYFVGQIYGGNTLRGTISVGNEKKRQRVYNTMFYVPLRCEWLILAGFFVCLDSFLSLLTIMPARFVIVFWRFFNIRQFRRPDAVELADFGCFVVLASGVVTLQLTDISLIYHIIRGQGTIKLYVVYNVLEVFDKLLQSFGEDVLQVLFSSAEGLATCSRERIIFVLLRFILDQIIAAVAFIVHSFILLAQAITLSTCIIARNNALTALLISNNFAEIKSNVFKKVSKDNLHSVVYFDIIERFHICAFLIFVLAQNILEAEGSWFEGFLYNAFLVYICEVFVDTNKHAFLAKFNEIKPDAYSDFLEDLCKQVLNTQLDEDRRNLNFIPLAPACMIIRVLTPIFATLLPYGPLPWRSFWIIVWSTLTFLILAICKILVGLSLNRLATWYINQRLASKQHVD